MRDAEAHFQAGKKHYLEGDEDEARAEFDRAIDILLALPEGAPNRAATDKKLDQLVEAIHRYDLAGMGIADIASEPGFEKPPLEDMPQLTFPIDPRLKNKVVEELKATVSQLPLEVSDAVLSYINYFSSERGRRVIVWGLRRAGKYRPMIQRILDEEGVPQELIFLAQAESGFLPRAVSRKRATGMWQFILARGREYGLLQTPYTDDRLDPEKATRAAARHLRDLFHRYGDWYLAIAAYNCGPGNVDRAVERTGYADFWELRRRNVLPKETANYVPIILAMTIMAKNAQEYGIHEVDPDPPLEFDTINITATTSLFLIADLTDSPVTQIRELNPALLKNSAPSGSLLRVPKGSATTLVAALEKVPPERRLAWRAHRVLEGESLASIASRYRMSEEAVTAVNQHSIGTDPESGDVLLIPAVYREEVTKKARKTRKYASRKRSSSKSVVSSKKKKGSSKAASSKRTSSKSAASARPRAKVSKSRSAKRSTLGMSASNTPQSRARQVKR